MDANLAIALVKEHGWTGLAILVIGFLVRMCKEDTRLPINIPKRWLPLVTLLLSLLYMILQLVVGGKTWKNAALEGAITVFVTLGGYAIVVKSVLNGWEPNPAPKSAGPATPAEEQSPPTQPNT